MLDTYYSNFISRQLYAQKCLKYRNIQYCLTAGRLNKHSNVAQCIMVCFRLALLTLAPPLCIRALLISSIAELTCLWLSSHWLLYGGCTLMILYSPLRSTDLLTHAQLSLQGANTESSDVLRLFLHNNCLLMR